MNIAIANRQRLAPIDRKTLRAICTRLLRDHGRDADLSLCFVANAEIRTLNTQFLGRDEITDVLAFPFDDDVSGRVAQPPLRQAQGRLSAVSGRGSVRVAQPPPAVSSGPPEGDRLLGEIIVSIEKAIAEAGKRRIPVAREIALYTAHGLLHLLGYDDHTPADRRRMRRAERAALVAEGIA